MSNVLIVLDKIAAHHRGDEKKKIEATRTSCEGQASLSTAT